MFVCVMLAAGGASAPSDAETRIAGILDTLKFSMEEFEPDARSLEDYDFFDEEFEPDARSFEDYDFDFFDEDRDARGTSVWVGDKAVYSACKKWGKYTKHRNGCTAYHQGWKKGTSCAHCKSSGASKNFGKCSKSKCYAFCANVYPRSHHEGWCKSGCDKYKSLGGCKKKVPTSSPTPDPSPAPVLDGFQNLGTGKCRKGSAMVDPPYNYRHGKGESSCRSECQSRSDCGGYSVSRYNNCLLWLSPSSTLKAGGNSHSWGNASCVTKKWKSG